VQPYDWAGFFRQRLDSTAAHAPLGGIDGGGWKLTYTAIPSGMWSAAAEEHKLTDLSYSLGFKVKDDGTIVDVTMGGPAHKAGIAPAAQLIAVDNRQFTPTVLHEAVQATAAGTSTLEFLVKTGEYYEVHRIEYMGGERFPSLVRNPAVPDLLLEIGAPPAEKKPSFAPAVVPPFPPLGQTLIP